MFIVLKLKNIIKCISVFTFILIFVFILSPGSTTDAPKIIQVSNSPVIKKTVILDAGHGLPDGGAVGSSGVCEEGINLKIAYKTKEQLEQHGFNVILTRTDENGIYDSSCTTIKQMKTSDIKKRVEIGNNSNADIFVSIHLNKLPQSQYWGWQTFFKQGNTESETLAKKIQLGLNETIEKENKRESLKIENIYIIDNINIPTTIVECGFLSNKEEEELLQNEEYQSKLALGITKGILYYFDMIK